MIATAMMFAACAAPAAGYTAPAPGRAGPPRQALGPGELVDAINSLLAARPDCEGLEVGAGRLDPAAPDADGCNWRADALRLRVAHGPSTRALAGVRQVVELARLRYELLDAGQVG